MRTSYKYRIVTSAIGLTLLFTTVVGKNYLHILMPHHDFNSYQQGGPDQLNPYFKCNICDFIFSSFNEDEPLQIPENCSQTCLAIRPLPESEPTFQYYNYADLRAPPYFS